MTVFGTEIISSKSDKKFTPIIVYILLDLGPIR